jgi:RNA polymerase sigma-70 factor (ECF subfamily)
LTLYPQETEDTVVKPEEWVDVYGDYLYRFAFARLRVASAAEEAVQETFLSGLRNLERFDGRGPQLAWLVTILKRKVVDAIRLRHKRGHIESYDPHVIDGEFYDLGMRLVGGSIQAEEFQFDVDESEIWQAVRECLEALTQPQADVFVLSVMEQLSTELICQELGISQELVWVRLHRARLALAKCVSRKMNWARGSSNE